MRAVDFVYDDVQLSSLGYMICSFDSTGSAETATAGSELTFETVPVHHGARFAFINSQYDTCYSVTFDICKNADSAEDAYLSMADISYLMKWLNRKDYHELVLMGSPKDTGVHSVYFNGSFNISQIEFAGRVIGLELAFTSDRPFGRLAAVTETLSISSDGSTTVAVEGDELGYIYPDSVVITVKQAGDLTLTNSTAQRATYIANCTAGEVITMDCVHQVITTSSTTHSTLYNDFNYNFFCLVSLFGGSDNTIKSSLACSVTLTYSPVCKAVF